MTINETANKEIVKAKRAILKAIEALTEEQAYNNKADIFHACTVYAVNKLITASQTLTEAQNR